MILGMGIDLVEIPRFERALDRWGLRLADRLFSDEEWEACGRRARPGECLAAGFAAKEAFLKALGTGLSGGIQWRDVELVRGRGAAPSIRIRGKAHEVFHGMGMERIWVSLSHEGTFSVAAVVIEGKQG
jgi:holo-[acyl-carrier protein] synthase